MVASLKWSVSGFGLAASTLLGAALACGNTDGKNPPGGSAGQGTAGSTEAGAGGVAGVAGVGGVAPGGSGNVAGNAEGAEGGTAGASGEAGAAGADAGEGGADGEPTVLEPVGQVPADKIDLLFVIDNSISMADKQEVFQDAVPLLVQRLITPVCVDAAGNPTGGHAAANGACATGEPEFPPIRDIHVGIVTSSLGARGGDICAGEMGDDKAHLLGSVRPSLVSWNDSGFLAWDPDGDRNEPPGQGNAALLITHFTDMVRAVGDTGCGYEASLEAWYRFLIDPDPPAAVTRNSTTQLNEITYPDPVTLAQREAFLRPDSLVGIVMLSDENDCSIVDEGMGYLVGLQTLGGGSFRMPRASSACETDPDDPCCVSCAAAGVPAECNIQADPECMLGVHTVAGDHVNMRCFDQKRRFGLDLLYPIERYLVGLTAAEVPDRSGQLVQNPLFEPDAGGRSRDLSRVFLMGIVGVPWQDLADEASLQDPTRLRYLTAAQLTAEDRWSLMLAEGSDPPRDGLMFETSLDRSTLGFDAHPLTGAAIAPSNSTSPTANPINGHESLIADASDLQYACIFPVRSPRLCDEGQPACDCMSNDMAYGRALCRPPAGGAVGTTQYFAKAYPSVRQLELLRALGDATGNGVVASICPKVLESNMGSTDPDYGYNPAISALIERMKGALAPTCLSEELSADASGQVTCRVLEVGSAAASCGACEGEARSEVTSSLRTAFLTRLEASRYCGGTGQPACDDLCVCEIDQLSGSGVAACQDDERVSDDLAGFCYVDASQGLGSDALVEHCPVGRKRRLRFVGSDIPKTGASTYLLCGD